MRVKAFFSLNEYFLGKLSDEALSGLTEASYKAMTANGDVKLRKGWDDRLTLLLLSRIMERVENLVKIWSGSIGFLAFKTQL